MKGLDTSKPDRIVTGEEGTTLGEQLEVAIAEIPEVAALKMKDFTATEMGPYITRCIVEEGMTRMSEIQKDFIDTYLAEAQIKDALRKVPGNERFIEMDGIEDELEQEADRLYTLIEKAIQRILK